MERKTSYSLFHPYNLSSFIGHALKEDIGFGDHTSAAIIPPISRNKAHLVMKENGIIAGVELAKKIFSAADKTLKVKVHKKDGAKVKRGDIVLSVAGNARSILTTERVVLNCMQRMSGIATVTNKLVNLCKPYKVKILDTRKTTPGMRELEKWAVRIGGGYNHRSGLYDMILIKNNHIDFAGGIKNAIVSANKYLKKKRLKLKIEIEARNIEEVKEILEVGLIDRILLDNFSVSEAKNAVKIINGKYETEISGGIHENNIRKYASCGADFLSVGALTHSVKALDMSLSAS